MAKPFTVIFGLTADPIHKGHEQAIINGLAHMHSLGFEIDKFILVPVYSPNLIANKKAPSAAFEQRVRMSEIVAQRLSTSLHCKIQVSQIEKTIAKKTGCKNFSLTTIQHLNIKKCLFMVSADHFTGRWPKFRQWFKWREILSVSGLLINQRPKHKINLNFINTLKTINANIFIVKSSKQIDISSAEIRNTSSTEYVSDDIAPLVKSLYQ